MIADAATTTGERRQERGVLRSSSAMRGGGVMIYDLAMVLRWNDKSLGTQ
jgi:hypothetical protein